MILFVEQPRITRCTTVREVHTALHVHDAKGVIALKFSLIPIRDHLKHHLPMLAPRPREFVCGFFLAGIFRHFCEPVDTRLPISFPFPVCGLGRNSSLIPLMGVVEFVSGEQVCDSKNGGEGSAHKAFSKCSVGAAYAGAP